MARILLVEDEAIIAMSVSLDLEEAGCHVTLARDGREGLEIALHERPDAIVTDYMMPRMDGLEMVRQLREAGYDRPIVMASAIPQSQLPRDGDGLDAYMDKPYDAGDVLKVLQDLERRTV